MLLFACAALADQYLVDEGFFVLGSLSIFWLAGTGWILAGRANQAGGWRELRTGEMLLVPIFTLATIIAEIVVIGFIGLGQMH